MVISLLDTINRMWHSYLATQHTHSLSHLCCYELCRIRARTNANEAKSLHICVYISKEPLYTKATNLKSIFYGCTPCQAQFASKKMMCGSVKYYKPTGTQICMRGCVGNIYMRVRCILYCTPYCTYSTVNTYYIRYLYNRQCCFSFF